MNNTNQRMHDVKRELYLVTVEKRALIPTDQVQAGEIKTAKTEKESLRTLLVHQKTSTSTYRKRRSTGDINNKLSVQLGILPSEGLGAVPIYYSRETAELFPFQVVERP